MDRLISEGHEIAYRDFLNVYLVAKEKITPEVRDIKRSVSGDWPYCLKKRHEAARKDSNVLETNFHALNQMFHLKQLNISIANWLEEHGYKRVAIYGMGQLAERLYYELETTAVKVLYAIDKNNITVLILTSLLIKSPYDEIDDVDAVIYQRYMGGI